MQACGQRTGVGVSDYSNDGKWLLLEIMLLNEQALCGRKSVDGLNEQMYALVIVRIQHAIGFVVMDGL